MEISNPLFSPKRVECVEKCLFCDKKITKAEKTNRIQQGWEKIQELAKEWKVLQIPVDDKMHHFTKLYDKIVDQREPFGVVHANCRIIFRNNKDRFITKYGEILDSENKPQHEEKIPEELGRNSYLLKPLLRSEHVGLNSKFLCFICNDQRQSDNNPYGEGGLARCSQKDAANKILDKTNYHMQNKNNKFYLAAKRLNMLLSGASHDIFAADIFYHRSCYRNYVRTKEQSVDQEKEKLKIQKDNILQMFFSKIRLKILIDKEAYMLNDLLKDIEVISNSHGVETVVKQTVELRRLLTSKFGEEISFFHLENTALYMLQILIHASIVLQRFKGLG